MDEDVIITLELPGEIAQALAQLCKRIGWSELRDNAEDDNDAYLIRDGVSALQDALAESGYSPR